MHPHIPVLLQQVTDFAKVDHGDTVVDATVGYGGHAEALLEKIGSTGKYLGIDKDEQAIAYCQSRLKRFGGIVKVENAAMGQMSQVAERLGIDQVDVVLMDLGVSSPQLDAPDSPISFKSSGSLDMRLGSGQGDQTAADIINKWDSTRLKKLFTEHGQTGTNRLVDAIIQARQKSPITSIPQLVQIVNQSVPHFPGINPATQVMQALRVEVNQEYQQIRLGLEQAVRLLKNGGRLLVISFQSGEDRIVKQFLQTESKDCICPSDYPVCRCDHRASLRVITSKPIVPDGVEVKSNPRSRSAKLRVAIRRMEDGA
ncbi:MAG: 16S rRNA (cytosine(1402)-N(4))-methyltransferase RsmH [Patescibacteria group bacterium]|jgi:16S rRNA (cytosine1402-N4)-methyltransferase